MNLTRRSRLSEVRLEMRRSLVRRGVSLSAAALVAAALMTTPALADGIGSSPSASQDGNKYIPQVIVTVTSSGVRKTVAVKPGSTTYVHPPCWREPSWTGPARADYYDSGDAARDARHHGDPPSDGKGPPGYDEHKNDGPDKGMFWSAMCSSEYWKGDIHAFLDYASDWITSHPTIWVGINDPNPNNDIVIPPAVLMEIAKGLLVPTAPTLEVNPQVDSVVNLPTWVWATDDSFVEIRARAEFNGNWAEVIARPAGLKLTTNGPGDVNSTCTNGGKPWTRGATDTDCSVTFRKSTASSGKYTISASIDWQVHWEGSGGENAALPPPPAAPIGNRAVTVDEVQTVVNGRSSGH
jgi:hypothetical protein